MRVRRVSGPSAVRELHYSPSALARALVTRRSGIVGVLVGDIVDPYFAEIARGIEDSAREAGYLVIVCNTDRIRRWSGAMLKRCRVTV